MNCEEFRNELMFLPDPEILSSKTGEHLAGCTACREYYNELKLLYNAAEYPEIKMTDEESRTFYTELDERIHRFTGNAFGFYNWAVRYGAALFALFLLVAVSMVSLDYPGEYHQTDEMTVYFNDTYDYTVIPSEEIDEDYVDLVVDEYQDNFGIGSSEFLIGELDDDEFEYLMQTLDIGDIL